MDGFVLKDVLMLLEGGNSQYSSFLSRQAIEGPIEKVYRTKAARYYRESLKSHVESLIEKGVQGWEGRVRRTSAAAKGGAGRAASVGAANGGSGSSRKGDKGEEKKGQSQTSSSSSSSTTKSAPATPDANSSNSNSNSKSSHKKHSSHKKEKAKKVKKSPSLPAPAPPPPPPPPPLPNFKTFHITFTSDSLGMSLTQRPHSDSRAQSSPVLESCLHVTRVQPYSQSEEGGVMVGDYIMEIQGKKAGEGFEVDMRRLKARPVTVKFGRAARDIIEARTTSVAEAAEKVGGGEMKMITIVGLIC